MVVKNPETLVNSEKIGKPLGAAAKVFPALLQPID